MRVPNHLAIIPDGNRRWAKARLLLPWQGHEKGVKRFWEITDAAGKAGIQRLTIWGGSYDNLAKRSEKEVAALFKILASELADPALLEKLVQNEIRFQVIGEWHKFGHAAEISQQIENLQNQTAQYDGKLLTILFGYDGRREMLTAVQALHENREEVNEENLRKRLWTGHLPDVDYVIRTGGEPHWSAGFMMWHTANSQFYFTEELWPDFDEEKLKTALEEFERRERRMGK